MSLPQVKLLVTFYIDGETLNTIESLSSSNGDDDEVESEADLKA